MLRRGEDRSTGMFADVRLLLVVVMMPSADSAAQQGCLIVLYISAVIQAGCETVCAEVPGQGG